MTYCNQNFLKHKYMGLAFHTMRGESFIFGKYYFRETTKLNFTGKKLQTQSSAISR